MINGEVASPGMPGTEEAELTHVDETWVGRAAKLPGRKLHALIDRAERFTDRRLNDSIG